MLLIDSDIWHKQETCFVSLFCIVMVGITASIIVDERIVKLLVWWTDDLTRSIYKMHLILKSSDFVHMSMLEVNLLQHVVVPFNRGWMVAVAATARMTGFLKRK
ncbi:hypothetical protein ACJX0J_006567 [Zea mays]